jgi:cell division protein FtsL
VVYATAIGIGRPSWQLSKLERARDELNIEFGRLQLEQATWAEATASTRSRAASWA